MGEMVPPHPVFGFEMADTGLDGGAPSQVSLDRLRDGPFLAADIDLELVVRRRIVAAVATVRNDARKIGSDQGFRLRQDRFERMTVVWVAGQRLPMRDELAAFRAVQRRGEGNLDAELIGSMGFTFADAFDLGCVQRIDLDASKNLAKSSSF